MKKIDWSSERKKTFWTNIFLFRWDKYVQKRDKKQWVFGGREGYQFDDNCRYMFEWMAKNHPEIKIAWIARTNGLTEKIKALGYDAYTFGTSEANEYAKHAGVALYSNGLIDFGPYPRVGGACIVSVWHGVTCKKLYNDSYSGWRLKAKKLLDKFFTWVYRDVTISTSDFVTRQSISAYGLKKDAKIYVCGQPRNDILFSGLDRKEILTKAGVDYKKNVIYYMPTYRMPSMGSKAMEKIVLDLYNSKALDDALTNTNSVFVAKLHPLTPHITIANRENFIVLDYGAVESNQRFLGVGDMMISDYSSTMMDFALLERPVVYYLPDNDEFLTKSEPQYPEFFELCKHDKCITPEELAEKILHPSKAAVNAINELFEDPSIKGTCYCENVYNAIVKEVGL